MKTLEVFEIAVKEWVFVVPLDFERNGTVPASDDVVYLMRRGFSILAVYHGSDSEGVFALEQVRN